jgi:cbb3-type cytochrome oxidase maturation protein
MYFPTWIILVTVSLGLSLAAFVWGLSSGQFSDQGRARYLPLQDEHPTPQAPTSWKTGAEIYVLFFVATMGLIGMVAAVVLSFCRAKG